MEDGNREDLAFERSELLQRFQDWLEIPMVVLAFVWLALFVAEIIWGLNPFLQVAGYAIWIAFLFEFGLDFLLAPRKLSYLKGNWLKGIALLAPALRIFRIVRLLRLARVSRLAGVTRGARLLRVISSLNRGMSALGASMTRRGLGYVLTLTVLVLVVGAAGMYGFEDLAGRKGLASYSEALWWTAMLMTTLGSEYWPQTGAGRFLCFILSLYGITMFGYLTAALASFFIGRDAENDQAEIAGEKSIAALRSEIAALREEIRILNGPASPEKEP